jgi:hypothetical protein
VDNRKYRRFDRDEERHGRYARRESREHEDLDRHWDCPFFKHCWDSGMSRLPTVDNCPECRQRKKDRADVSVFKRLGPLPSQNRCTESSRAEDFEDSEDEEEKIDTTGQGGALMDSAIPRSVGFSGYETWRKPRENTCAR